MKALITLSLVTISLNAHAAFKLQPGLWEIQTKTNINGKSGDHMAKMQEAMKKLSPEQRAQMEKMMGSKGMGFGDKGMKVCHNEITSSPENMAGDAKSKCTITDKKDLATGIKFTYKCDNGSGTAEYHTTSATDYNGWNDIKTNKGQSRIEFTGKFLSKDCGNIKPLQAVTAK